MGFLDDMGSPYGRGAGTRGGARGRGMLSLPFQRRQYIMPQILCALCPSAGNETEPAARPDAGRSLPD